MAQQAQETINVRTPGGKVIPILKTDLATAIKRGAVPVNATQEEAKKTEAGPTKTSLWESANMPLGEKEFRKKGITGGIPQAERQSIAKMIGNMNISDDSKRKLAYALDIPAELITSVGEAARRMTTPVSLGTAAAGGLLEKLRSLAGVPTAVKALAAGTEAAGGAAFGKQGIEAAATGKQKGESALDEIERRLAGLGQGIMGLAPIAHATGPTVKEGAKTGSRELLGIGDKSVERASKEAQSKAAEETAKFEKSKAEREAEVAEQKAEKEKRDAQTLKEHKELQEQSKAKARGEHEAAELKRKSEIGKKAKEFQRELVEKKKAEEHNARIETARKALDQTVQQKSKAFTDNMNKVIAEGKKHFDQRYGEFDEKILGKSTAFPKGTAESDLSAFANSVENAKKNLIEGSPEKIKQFENVIKLAQEGDEFIDAEGGMKIAPGQKIPTVDLRGFVTELDSAIYGRDLLPDVRNALKSVAEAGKAEVLSTVKRIGGDTAVKTLKELNSDYNDYLTDWRDTSSVNPLPKLRNTLLEGVVQKNPAVLADLDIAKQLQGSKGQTALSLLDKYKKFGADPSILADYRKALDRIRALDKMKKVPEVGKPDYPERITKAKIDPPKPPEIEPFKARGKDPQRPESKPFNPEEFRKEKIGQKAESLSNLSMWDIAAMSAAIEEFFKGRPETGVAAGSIPVIKRLLARGLSNEGVIDWLSKDKEAGAPPKPTAPAYKPSEKAETMSGERKDLGKEFESGQRTHEIDRLKKILRNDRATNEDIKYARQRLSELGVTP
jgi:hypothetical protein